MPQLYQVAKHLQHMRRSQLVCVFHHQEKKKNGVVLDIMFKVPKEPKVVMLNPRDLKTCCYTSITFSELSHWLF